MRKELRGSCIWIPAFAGMTHGSFAKALPSQEHGRRFRPSSLRTVIPIESRTAPNAKGADIAVGPRSPRFDRRAALRRASLSNRWSAACPVKAARAPVRTFRSPEAGRRRPCEERSGAGPGDLLDLAPKRGVSHRPRHHRPVCRPNGQGCRPIICGLRTARSPGRRAGAASDTVPAHSPRVRSRDRGRGAAGPASSPTGHSVPCGTEHPIRGQAPERLAISRQIVPHLTAMMLSRSPSRAKAEKALPPCG